MVSVGLLAISPLLVAGTGESTWWIVPFGVIALAFSTVGLMLARRVPGNAIGWLFLVFGAITAIAVLADAYSIRGLSAGSELPGATAAVVVSSVIFGPLFVFGLVARLCCSQAAGRR